MPGVGRGVFSLTVFRRAPPFLKVAIGAALLVLLWAALNGIVQVVRKPTEFFLPLSGSLYKTPSETWQAYAHLFRRHATHVMTPELLAALAQVEATGNPVARTYWRWSWSTNPFEIYRPASSAVGMYQITDGTFEQAKRYCIHDHEVALAGPWHDWRSCWFSELYFRVLPSHAIELTSAFLQRSVSATLTRHGIRGATQSQKQRLAVLTHLCGVGAANRSLRRDLAVPPGLRCGDHAVGGYLTRVEAMRRKFAALAARA
jgi:hypothetical protein